MAGPYDQLLVVQEFDTTLSQLRYRHAHHEIRAEIDEIDAKRAELEASSSEIVAKRHALEREQKRLDDEVALVDDRRTQIETKLYDGSVTATKDLLALQEEAAHLGERKSALEDEELEVMEAVEQINRELQPVVDTIESLDETRSAREAALTVALAEVDAEIERIEADRAVAAAPIPADLIATYDSLRHDFGGIAVARLVGSSCDGCHMTLSAVAVDRINKQPADALITCDQCGRLLVR